MSPSRQPEGRRGAGWESLSRRLRDWLRGAARAAGYEIHRRPSLGRTMGDALEQARAAGVRPATVIDVGVARGTPELYAAFGGARHLLIEPVAEFEPDLARLAARLGGSYVIAAAGRAAGEVSLAVRAEPGHSSTLSEADGSDAGAPRRTVPVVTIDALCAERGLPADFVIKLDVQGAELEALEGARAVLERTQLVVAETSLFRFQAGCPELSEVVAWMRERGFAVYDVCGGVFRPHDGALAQLDLVFAPESGPLREYHGYRSPPPA